MLTNACGVRTVRVGFYGNSWAKILHEFGRNPSQPWLRQTASLTIDDDVDYVSDSGIEIWNILEHHGIKHVILMGVHTNMCVIGRPFGLRQLKRCGKHNVVLMRDSESPHNRTHRFTMCAHCRCLPAKLPPASQGLRFAAMQPCGGAVS